MIGQPLVILYHDCLTQTPFLSLVYMCSIEYWIMNLVTFTWLITLTKCGSQSRVYINHRVWRMEATLLKMVDKQCEWSVTSIFGLVNSSIKNMKLECLLHPSHYTGEPLPRKFRPEAETFGIFLNCGRP